MNKAGRLIRDWLLPLALSLGVGIYLAYHFLLPGLHSQGYWLHPFVSVGQRVGIALLLFFQFVKISPHDLRLCRWHLGALALQSGLFLALALLIRLLAPGVGRMLLECAMICLICPTAAAAGVITDRLGGDLAATVTYLVMINVVGTFLIPLVIPLVNPSQSLGFWSYVGHIAIRVFPLLILPGLAAWLIRYTCPRLQRRLMRWASGAFYIWGVCLTMAMVLATRALVLSGLGLWAVSGIVAVSLACCAFQFAAGRRLGAQTAGQALGQKNTGFLIWLGYSYMTPVTSVAGGLYAIWQNLYNSWELYRKEHSARISRV